MLNRILKISLSNRAVTLIIAGLLLIWGCITMLRTDVDIFPDLNAPTVVVMTEAPGMAPEEVEKTVTFPIETALNGATGVRRVRSSSSTGFSIVWVEFDWDSDVYKCRQTVGEKLSAVASQLPSSVGAPTLGPQSSILGEMLIVGLTSDSTSMMQLRSIADRIITPRLLSLQGVSQVSVIGGDVKEYQILLSPERMRHHGVSLDNVMEAVESFNDNASGGILYDYGNEYLIKGDITSVKADEMGMTAVATSSGRHVTLADIAEVKLGPQTPRLGAASVKAEPAVLITVTKQPHQGSNDLTRNILADLDEIASTLPSDIHISTDIFRQSDFIDASISNLQTSLFEGAIFVIVVLFFFLMNIRTTLISLVALPLSIIVTLLILGKFGFTINTMSLGGIAIAIGSLVDDAIVDVENVYRRLKENHRLPSAERLSVVKVVFEASREVRLPILNSSLIIIASFLPLFFLSGIEGRLLKPLGISFIVALTASTVVALTVTPVLCSYLLGSDKAAKALDSEPWLTRKMRGAYRRMLDWSFRNKRLVLLTTALLFAVALGFFFTLGRSFLPPFNEGSLTINISALPGISLEESDKVGREAERIILETPEIITTARKTGRAELDEHSFGANVSEIEAPYRLDGRSRRDMVSDLRANLSALPGVNIEIGQPISHRIDAMLSGTEAQIAIKIFGDNLETLHRIALEVGSDIKKIPGVVDVNVEQSTGRPQIDIRPKRVMMAKYGVTNAALARTINVMIAGQPVSQVYEGNMPYDVTVKASDRSRSSISNMSEITVESDQGPIPLSYVADIVSTTGPNTVNRENVSRRTVVSANVDGRDLRSVINEIKQTLGKDIELPEGYHIAYGGQFESEASASRTLMLASAAALLVIFLLLYQEYKNFKQPLIILINMPLAMIGGILILRLTSGELNIPAIIGFIALLGIATRNGMLLISRYNALKAEGEGLIQRIYHGSVDRLNPIIMTALTSALALIPLAVRGSEPGNEIQSPMAVVILGGLLTSTVLNLIVVPIIYSISETYKKNK